MKTLPSALAAHIATRETTLATALKITRTDAQVFGFTSHDVDASIGGVTYAANPGLNVTDIEIASDAAVGNLELTTLHDGTLFTTADILGGVWRNAAFTIFRYNWASLSDGIDTLLVGTLGECELKQNSVVVELRDLRQYLQQPIGKISSKTCRARLTDAQCKVVLYPFSGTITHVTSNQVFRDSTRAEAAGMFDEGLLTFTDGENSGITVRVMTHAADGTFSLALPLYGTVIVGDAYQVYAGCDKTRETCRDKFSNVLNFDGEPDRKGMNDLTKPAG